MNRESKALSPNQAFDIHGLQAAGCSNRDSYYLFINMYSQLHRKFKTT